MIKVEHIDTMNWANAMRAMRHPLESYAKSDSHYETPESRKYILGENDLGLLCRLSRAGRDHRKVLRQILVSMDISAPIYWWKEFDTYKVGTTANSTSTMHCIHKSEFVLEDFSFDKTLPMAMESVELVLKALNQLRDKFLETKDKSYWYSMIQLLPSSYNQTRTVTMNYEVLVGMYFSRKHHKLDEWREFCAMIEEMPYMSDILEASAPPRSTH